MSEQNKWVIDVPLNYTVFIFVDAHRIAYNIDAPALTRTTRLTNPIVVSQKSSTFIFLNHKNLSPLSHESFKKAFPLVWQNKGFWNKIKIICLVFFFHALYIFSHSILASELNRHRKVIDLLIGIQTLKKISFALSVGP